MLAQRFRSHPRNYRKATNAAKKLKTIAGRLIRDVQRKLPESLLSEYGGELNLFTQVLGQSKNSKNKIYSLHEPQVYSIGKGKVHKKYEFGAKASVAVTKGSGVIVGAVSHPENIHDSKTLVEVISQSTEPRGVCPEAAICDGGSRGKSKVGEPRILIPKPSGINASQYLRQKARRQFRRRAGVEPIIGHLKSDYRMARNFLKGAIGDSVDLMLAAAAFNFKKWMRESPAFLRLVLMHAVFWTAFEKSTARA